MSPMVIGGLVLFVVVVAIVLIALGLRRGSETEDLLAQRLAEFAAMEGEISSLEDLELQIPFTERVIIPLLQRIGDFASRLAPQNIQQNLDAQLEKAGRPAGLTPGTFWALRFVMAGLFTLVALLVVRRGGVFTGLIKFLMVVGLPFLGYFLPQLWLTSKIQRRQLEIRRAMPDALDLLTICVEAGLGFEAAMKKVNEKWDNELSLAFGRVLQEVQLGKLRREALRDMAERIDIPEMTSFVAAIIQAEQLGVSMANVLRIQSEQMRIRRRQAAEQEAHKAPIKMLFPMQNDKRIHSAFRNQKSKIDRLVFSS